MLTIRKFLPSIAAVFLWLVASAASAATYYVATTGSDSTGDGSSTRPFKTIGAGLNKIASGDTLIVKAGTYTDLGNFINSRVYKLPSGTAGKYTTIMAETPFSVRLKNTGSLNYYDSPVFLARDYVHIDGFVFEINNTPDPEHMASISGSYNKLTRTIFKRTGPTNQYGGWVWIGGNNNLLEDCAGVGSARYGFSIGGPTDTAQRNIIRRCVGRVDYSVSNQPKATFNVYGNDSGTNVRDVLLQNCIAIDGRAGPSSQEPTYGGFYFPKNAAGVTIQGSIVLNTEAAYAGYFVKELGAQDLKMVDSIAWGGTGAASQAGIRANSSGAGTYFTLNHVTVGKYGAAYYNKDSAPQRILQNSLLVDNGSLAEGSDFGWTTLTNNAYSSSVQLKGTAAISLSVSPLKYIVRSESGSLLSGKATDGADVGANVTKRYGKSGTLWGESGYDQVTTEGLWPWLYEDKIKAVFAESNPPPAGAVPTTNDTTRGFAAAIDQFGKPQTLTRYIWQYLGNQIPAEIYGTTPVTLQAPSGLQATLVK